MKLRNNSASTNYIGAVYERGTGKPLASVAVSNGRDVVLTDESGRYALNDWHKADFITVTIPSGYWTSNYYLPVSREKQIMTSFWTGLRPMLQATLSYMWQTAKLVPLGQENGLKNCAELWKKLTPPLSSTPAISAILTASGHISVT